ncbi:YihY/virulence factor BrkB family protein [Streptomyces triticiradicis]|uniref:YihY/virulence factor BrkB family protein n=1 Tax=Streptomyces triticiradicis TaxID=2651189 RepID=A0A7J5DDU5_9ACTN|nr:YihY/virulence factor BrkB family protein [Streptomyces triticiradicis]KAB1986037.1 YihY/virulence factor BrkB family protein [Streptomyces triticiradicis]
MPKKAPPDADDDRPAPRARLYAALHNSPFGRGWRHSKAIELGQRSLGFAALGFLTLVPLLIVVSAADPAHGRGFAEWLGDGLGVSSAARDEVARLFAGPAQVRQTTTAFGLAALAVFGLSFGAAVQTGYEKVWDLSAARWYARWRQVLWLAVLIGSIYVTATTTLWRHSAAGTVAAALSAVLFFWWSQWMLLGGRIAAGALLPGAVLTALGLLGLRVFSRRVFSPLIASSTVSYGPFGTVLVVQSWLVGVGVVVFGGALLGRLAHEEITTGARTLRRRGRGRER